MKYLIASDLHGSSYAYGILPALIQREQPDELVLCGDLVSSGRVTEFIKKTLSDLPLLPVVVEGNCDRRAMEREEVDYRGEYYFSKKIGRTVCFTHGHIYNYSRIPPVLGTGDVLIYGHNHFPSLTEKEGIFIGNVGSLGTPRAGSVPSYMTLDENGIFSLDAETGALLDRLYFLK